MRTLNLRTLAITSMFSVIIVTNSYAQNETEGILKMDLNENIVPRSLTQNPKYKVEVDKKDSNLTLSITNKVSGCRAFLYLTKSTSATQAKRVVESSVVFMRSSGPTPVDKRLSDLAGTKVWFTGADTDKNYGGRAQFSIDCYMITIVLMPKAERGADGKPVFGKLDSDDLKLPELVCKDMTQNIRTQARQLRKN